MQTNHNTGQIEGEADDKKRALLRLRLKMKQMQDELEKREIRD